MRAFTRTLTVTGSIAAAIAVGGMAAAHAAGTTLSEGHVDVLDVEYDGVGLDLHVHDESVTPDVEYAPADVVLQALPASAYTVPSGTCYSRLGTAGATVYRLSQVEHDHADWVFTNAGSYTATFQVSGTLANGTPVGPTSATYTFQVG